MGIFLVVISLGAAINDPMNYGTRRQGLILDGRYLGMNR